MNDFVQYVIGCTLEIQEYGPHLNNENVTQSQRQWIADFICDAWVDNMPPHDAAARIVNEYSQH